MRQEGPGGSTGLAGWLSCQMGIGWGWDPCKVPALSCALVLALVTPEHPQGHGVAGAARAMGGRDGVQKHPGMQGWGSGACPLQHQWLQELMAAMCRPGAVELGVPLTCPHSPGSSMPYSSLV